MNEYAYIDGEIVPTKTAKVPINDIGFLRGFAIYEGITTLNGKSVFLKEHLDRFEKAANFLKISTPFNWTEMATIIDSLAAKIDSGRGVMRVFITGGVSVDGISPGKQGAFYATVEDLKPLAPELYVTGGKIITKDYKRFRPEYKTVNYIFASMSQDERREAQAQEILYTHKDLVFECATSNIFLVKDGELFTPTKEILYGITRMKVIELAKKLDITVHEGEVTNKMLFEADEVFMTSSFKDVLPIVTIDEKTIADGKVGSVSLRIIEAFKGLLGSL